MPSTNKTSTGLNQWIGSDKPKMADFNADNAIIDEKIKRIKTNGDGTKYLADDGTYKEAGGGTPSTTDYADLDNKPSINGIELDGDKTAEDIDVADRQHRHDYSDIDNQPDLSKYLMAENIIAGLNVSITKVGNNVTVSSTGGGGGGTSPIATVNKVGNAATITITDVNGTTTATVYDGANGSDGKTAYQSAVDGGYTGTETEFNTSLASIGDISAVLDNINGEVV